MDVEDVANEARVAISDYCINECHAYCCRKGFLILNEEEARLTVGKNNFNLLKKTNDGNFSLNLSGGCPSLKENKCLIHKNEKRSSTCKNFPIFIYKDKTIQISDRCPAKKEGLFYPFIYQFIKLGYQVK